MNAPESLGFSARREWLSLVLLVLPFLVVPFVWNLVPDRVPIHWNFQGEADGYAGKPMGLLLLPLVSLGVYALLLLLPRIDPKRQGAAQARALRAFRLLLPLLMDVLYFVILGVVLGRIDNMAAVMHPILLLMFLVMGNYMGAIQPNYFLGIRTPWTLEDPENWRRTHRITGRFWVAGSLVMGVLWLLLPLSTYQYVFWTGTILFVLVPFGYSLGFYFHRKKQSHVS